MGSIEGIDPEWLITLCSKLESLDKKLTDKEKQKVKKYFFKYLHEGLTSEEAFQKAYEKIIDE